MTIALDQSTWMAIISAEILRHKTHSGKRLNDLVAIVRSGAHAANYLMIQFTLIWFLRKYLPLGWFGTYNTTITSRIPPEHSFLLTGVSALLIHWSWDYCQNARAMYVLGVPNDWLAHKVPLKPRPNDRNISKHCWPNICRLRPTDRNISAPHIVTLLGATCRARLATLLRGVATCWVLKIIPVCMSGCNIVARTWSNDHNIMQHPQMLHEKFDQFQIWASDTQRVATPKNSKI